MAILYVLDTLNVTSSCFKRLKLWSEKILGQVGDLQLFFHLGAYKLGPFRTFPERSVSELCELPVDWRKLVEKVCQRGSDQRGGWKFLQGVEPKIGVVVYPPKWSICS